MELRRGDVYLADLPELQNSNVQKGKRPVIIVSNEMALKYSPVVQYIPLTTKLGKPKLPVHVDLTADFLEPSIALVEQIGCIDKKRLIKKKGTLSKLDMFKIDYALIKQCDINIDMLRNIKQKQYAIA